MKRSNILCLLILQKNNSRYKVITKYENGQSFNEAPLCVAINAQGNFEQNRNYTFDVGVDHCMINKNSIGLLYVVVSIKEFPTRCMKLILTDMMNMLSVGGYIDNQSMMRLCVKYENPATYDSLYKTTIKVDEVKLIMNDNIKLALENCVKLEHIEEQSEYLMQQAGKFKGDAKKLNCIMWWENIKMKVILGFIILCILAIIIGTIAGTVSNSK